ncbi:MAG: hypothetical protein JEZ03_11490 [Bacteroidales bacterium]|nr:hypothetical protein [Bacteroidales bacterium]
MVREEQIQIPNITYLSVITVMVLLAYSAIPFLNYPEREISYELLGIVFTFNYNFANLISLINAGLAAAGTDWMIRSHPKLSSKRTIHHWILPALSAWILGFPLNTMEPDIQWWVVLILGGIFIVFILIAEYIVVDFSDNLHPLASTALSAFSYAILLFLFVAIKAAEIRLFLAFPILFISMFLVILRNFYLRFNQKWMWLQAVVISLAVAEIGIGLHYWPISPIVYGLLLMGIGYAISNSIAAVKEGFSVQFAWIEGVIMFSVISGLAFYYWIFG